MKTIRLATEADAGPIRRIYAPFCGADSPVSFEVEPPTEAEMARRIAGILGRHPWLVSEDRGEVTGYAYAGPHGERAAYLWSVTVAIYVGEGHRGSGLGRALYASLLAILKFQGFINAYAGVVLPNPASVALHRASGFEPVGVYRGVGYKCGAWLDASWWGRTLGDRPAHPETPLTLAEARRSPGWAGAIGAGLPWMRPGGSVDDDRSQTGGSGS